MSEEPAEHAGACFGQHPRDAELRREPFEQFAQRKFPVDRGQPEHRGAARLEFGGEVRIAVERLEIARDEQRLLAGGPDKL